MKTLQDITPVPFSCRPLFLSHAFNSASEPRLTCLRSSAPVVIANMNDVVLEVLELRFGIFCSVQILLIVCQQDAGQAAAIWGVDPVERIDRKKVVRASAMDRSENADQSRQVRLLPYDQSESEDEIENESP